MDTDARSHRSKMSLGTSQTQARHHANTSNEKDVDDNDIGTTDADTSSWESEPHTARSARQYHPVKGERTRMDSDDEDNDEELLTNGGIPENPVFGNQELLSSEYLRKTFGLDGMDRRKDADQHWGNNKDATLQAPRERQSQNEAGIQNGLRKDGHSSSDPRQEGGDQGSGNSCKGDKQDIEELDLTKEPKPSLFGRGMPGMPQAKFFIMPPLGSFASSPFGSLMTGLLSSDGEGFENDADVSSQSEAEEERPPRGKPQFSPGMDQRSQQERWEQLFGMLEQQHRQQLILQREHHERQVQLLQMQLARLTEEQEELISKQHQEPLGRGSKTPADQNLQDAGKQSQRSHNGNEGMRVIKDENTEILGSTPSEGGDQGKHSTSGDSDATLEGSLADASETLMTTWSDIIEQKQSEKERGRLQSRKEKLKKEMQERNPKELEMQKGRSRAQRDRFVTLQSQFEQQQQQLQEQYARQMEHLQQQWVELQTQQHQQQEVLRHLLSRQQERITQTHRHAQAATQARKAEDSRGEGDPRDKDRGSPTSDDTSTVYSDFTYWKQAEKDTYRALPDMSIEDAAGGQGGQVPGTVQGRRLYHQHSPELSVGNDSWHSSEGRSPNPGPQGSPELAVPWLASGPGQRSPHASGQSSSPQRPGDNREQGDDAQLTSSLRLNLREKHARHIADLKAYYETEIQELQNQLTEAASLQDHSPDKVMRRTNQRLEDNCIKQEAALKSANSRIKDLENTVQALETRLGETYSSTDSSVATLKQKVDDLKQLCRHKELDVQSLEKRNRELQVSLDQAYQLQDVQAMDEHRDQKILKRVLTEYKSLAEKHEITQELLHDTETQLYESKAKIAELTRKVSLLEFEVRRIDLESSILKRQSLPESLSGTSLRSRTSPGATPNAAPATLRALDSHPQDGHHGTSGTAKDTRNAQDSSAVARSVEERKFLRPSADYNILTGEKLQGSLSGSESLQIMSDTESLTQPEDNRDNLAAPTHHSDLGVPFDTDTDEERPLSPMMKAARQFEVWKAEETRNAAGGKGLTLKGLNGTRLADRPDRPEGPNMHHHNRSTNNSGGHSHGSKKVKATLESSPLTQDSSIHIWPASGVKSTGRSPTAPGPSKVGAALAHSSPKQLARQSLAKAIKPRDHDLFPVRETRNSPQEAKQGSAAPTRQSFERAPSLVGLRKTKESPRRQLFADNKKSDNRLERGDNIANSVLAKVRAGEVQTRADWEEPGSSSAQRSQTPKKQTESGLDIIQRINDNQKKLDQLIMEKRQLETTLSHMPISGRVSRQTRQEEEHLEQRLEHVTQELGSVRMLLRKYNALKSSI
ncbi:uncharacterized protein LOC110980709 isoform X2 [Acanthaster planci]|uniref:Uncharacterized protein LOC110980709 isoform X2 n=1 Tax=Acanthaster planci TaxID=133434 RepID=A0A8B7YL03_ACAPL|nr:uncharacterized protein LOC110980709 isoform X2 [Acanthaster planci]